MANSGEPLHVPEDITVDILRRLPAESLLRFQCVCKSWRELIQSAQFVQSHTNDVNRRTRAIFFKDRWPPYSSRKKFSGFNVEDEVDKLKKMKLRDTIRLRGNYVIHGHCNGIICLSPVYSGVPDILLWNPTLRQCRALPPSRFFSCKHLFQFGFGYDSTNQDYKVVNLHLPIHGISEMYSFKSNSWKPIHFDHLRFLKYEPYTNSSCGCLFKGRLHWIVHCDPGSKMFLVVFDLNEDKFLEFDTPESLYQTLYLEFGHNLGVFRGRLSLLTRNFNEYEIWSLKDDWCTLKSWTRAWKFSPEGISVYGFPTVPSFALWFIELTQDGKVVLKSYFEKFVYLLRLRGRTPLLLLRRTNAQVSFENSFLSSSAPDYANGESSYYEAVVGVAHNKILSVCLARNQHTSEGSSPFISSLEVLFLEDSVYNSTDFQKNLLVTVARSSFGMEKDVIRL